MVCWRAKIKSSARLADNIRRGWWVMRRFSVRRQEGGAVLALTALMITVLILCTALAIDLGHLYLVKCELRAAADAGALAGAAGLFPPSSGTSNPLPATPDCARAFTSCQSIVAANQADGATLQVLSEDVIFGNWDAGTNSFNATGCADPRLVNAVKVVVRKDTSANGKVPLFFAGIIPGGLSSVGLTAEAISLSGYPGYVPGGGGAFPLAIDANKVPPGHGGELIRIYLNPTTTDGGCWQTFFDPSPGANDLKNLVNGTTPSPALKVGDQIRVTEGVADSVMQELQKVFDKSTGDMVVLVPVIPGDSHTGLATVQGFVALKLTLVDSHGTEKRLEGVTVPDYVAPGGVPGGPNNGLWAGLPRLVQ
jgi:Flp pilus assembly protein TadG